MTWQSLRTMRFHDLRHTYAPILIAQGENLKFIQQQLGHSSAQVTLDRYGHLMPQVQHGAGERLENSLFGQSIQSPSISKTLAKSQKLGFSSKTSKSNSPSELEKKMERAAGLEPATFSLG